MSDMTARPAAGNARLHSRERQAMRASVLLGVGIVVTSAAAVPASGDYFDEPLFRRCIDWMLTGTRGSLIGNLCIDQYALPPPSLFLCARKVHTGFASEADREGCAIVFDEEAKRVRAGFIR